MTASKKQILQGFKKGRITSEEANRYLQRVHHTSLEDEQTKSWKSYAIIGVLLVVFALGLWFAPDAPTGYAVYNISGENITDLTTPIPENITRLTVSGVMTGEGTARVRFSTAVGDLTVATLTSDPGTPRTTFASYATDAEVTLEHITGNATYYLDDGAETTAVSIPFAAPAVGLYEILVIQNVSGTLTSTRIPLVVSDTPVERTTEFVGVCEETCILSGINGTLNVETDGTTVTLRAVDVEYGGTNEKPVVIEQMQDLTINETYVLDLDDHFADPEGEVLLYSTSSSDFADVTVDDGILTLEPLSSGTELFIVYTSDLEHLVEESFILTVEFEKIVNETETNNTIPEINDTNVTRTNATNVTQTNVTIGCDHPNPNLRPIECLQNRSEEYFPQEEIFWENTQRTKVAQFNQIGNLLIKGDIVELSSANPASDDFRLGNIDRDGQVIPAVWVDGTTGDLHLKGRLYEEVATMQPSPGSYSVLSRRSIYLAYADLGTGDLYLRGNIIPYRRTLG